MAVVEENWQTKCSAIAERTTFIFNTEFNTDKDLKDRCWKVIEEQTEEALKSDEFVTIEDR